MYASQYLLNSLSAMTVFYNSLSDVRSAAGHM